MDLATYIIKFNAQTAGRDKICRLIQYSSKFGWWYAEQIRKSPDLVKKLKDLEIALSSTRKVIRLGKSLDMLKSALASMHLSDIAHRFTITFAKINQALFLLVDHVLWAAKVGLVKVDTKKYKDLSAKFWLVTLIFNIARNLYDILSIVENQLHARNQQQKRSQYANGDVQHSAKTHRVPSNAELLKRCFAENKPVWIDSAKNACDLFLPLCSLDYVRFSAGTQGLLGVASSLFAIAVLVNPMYKLSPS